MGGSEQSGEQVIRDVNVIQLPRCGKCRIYIVHDVGFSWNNSRDGWDNEDPESWQAVAENLLT